MRTPPPEYLLHFKKGLPTEGELTVNPYYFILWHPHELELMNREYQVVQYAPEFLGFASSGGGEMLAFDSNNEIFTLPFIGMAPKNAVRVAKNWSELLSYMKV